LILYRQKLFNTISSEQPIKEKQILIRRSFFVLFCLVLFVIHNLCTGFIQHSFDYDFDNEYQLEDVELIHRHMLLIRDPVEVLSAWGANKDVHGDNPTSDELGICSLLAIYSKLESKPNGVKPVVVDSDELANDPKNMLSYLCECLSIEYSDSMLSWKSGEHKCDGPWATWWYHSVHMSNGWSLPSSQNTQQTKKYRTLNPVLMPALKISLPAYLFLSQLTQSYTRRGPPPSEIYEDPRNENLLVWIGAPKRGRLIPRSMAGVSPWDSSVQGGDGCWEGLRGMPILLDVLTFFLFIYARVILTIIPFSSNLL
jgi:hypothetical protein